MQPVLKVENLTKVYGKNRETGHVGADGISFQVMPGESVGLIGESGSGKTTVVNMITRIIDPTGGTIFVDGEDITRLSGRKLIPVYKKMQMVFQTPTESFDPRQRIGAGIGESLQNDGIEGGVIKSRVSKLLEQCGLSPSFADRYPHELSGGQCQRAAIARAIAINPKLLICDEATSSLDVTIQKEIMQLLCDLKKELDLSILFICHDVALVQSFCDRLIVMYQGRIVEEGTPDEVIKSPRDPYTKRLIESIFQ